jgi:hypothetical protein
MMSKITVESGNLVINNPDVEILALRLSELSNKSLIDLAQRLIDLNHKAASRLETALWAADQENFAD